MDIKLDLSYLFYKRKANGYTLEEISEGTGINVKRLSKAEKTNDIRLSDLLKIAVFFGVGERELYRYKIIE